MDTVRMAKKHSRKATRRSKRYRGGFEPAPVTWTTEVPSTLNLAQGQQFQELNKLYHGGATFYGGPYPGSVTDSGLPADLAASAHLSPLNKAFADVAGLKDQAGGKRRRSSKRKSRRSASKRKGHRKSRRSASKRKAHRKSRRSAHRKSRGGGALNPMPMSDFNKMLLPAGLEGRAGLNPEWKLAEDPNAFAPY